MTVLNNEKVALMSYDYGGAIYNAKHPAFGLTGDGVTKETVALRAMLASGEDRHFYFPTGDYLIDPATTFSLMSGQKLEMAPGARFVVDDAIGLAADGYIFTATLGADDIVFQNVVIDGNRSGQTKRIRAIVGFKSRNIRIDNCHFYDFGGSAVVLSNCPGNIVTRNTVEYCGRKWSGATGNQGEQGISVLCDVAATDPFYAPGSVIAFNNVSFCGWDGINFSAPYTKVIGNTVHHCGIEFLTVGAGGIFYSGNATMGPHGSLISGNTVYSCTGNGIDTGPSVIMVEGVKIVNNNSYNNMEAGIVIADGRYFLVEGNRCWNNYQASTTDENGNSVTLTNRTIEKGGITITSSTTLSCDKSIVRNNTCYDDQTPKTQVYGIQMGSSNPAASHLTDLTVEDNMVVGNLTAGIGSAESGKAAPWVDAGSYAAIHRNNGQTLTITSGAAVPNFLEFINVTMSAPTNITSISAGRYGDRITLLFNNSNATLVHAAALVLKGAINVNPASGNMITLMCDGTSSGVNWREISRNF